MHRTNGDSYGTAPSYMGPSVHVYRDYSPGNYDSTQARHQEHNAFQEEICNVIEAEGYTLQTDSETVAQMFQLNTAINNKLKASRIVNDSLQSGAYVDDALDNIGARITMLDSDDISNASSIPGTSVSDAIDNISTDYVANDSTLNGTTLTDVLDDLDDTEIKDNTSMEGATVGANIELLCTQRDRHIIGCGYGNDSSNRNVFIFQEGNAVDVLTNQYLLSVPYQSGGYRKSIVNGAGWSAGHNNCGLPAAITCVAGTRLYIFLIRRLDTTIDIGFDTDINAANLYADGTCQARRWRRIGYCQVESIDGSDCDCWICTSKNGWHYVGSGNGYARGIAYDTIMSAAFAYIVGNDQYLPNFDCIAIFRPLPPTGAPVVNCTTLPRYMATALGDLQAESYFNSFVLTTAGSDVILSTGGVEMMPAYMSDPENGFIVGVNVYSGVTTHFRIMGFYDFRDQQQT